MTTRRIMLGLLAAALAGAGSESYRIGGSRFALEVDKTGLMRGKTHLFLFERYGGRLEYDAADPGKSKVTLVIEAGSIVCKDTWVSEKDLKKIQAHAEEEMLAVKKHPEIRFVSSEVVPKGGGKFDVFGDLTIRGLARPARVMVEMKPDGERIAFHGTAVVKMTDYGLKPPTAVLGAIGTKDEMRVSFDLIASKN